MKGLFTLIFLVLAQNIASAQGLIQPIEFYQEEAEVDLSWEESLPPLLPTNDSEISQL